MTARLRLLAWVGVLQGCFYTPAPMTAQSIELRITRAAPVYIDVNNNYAETGRFAVRAVFAAGHARAGETATQVNATLRIEEWRTRIYDGRFGATHLPMQVEMRAGQARFNLRSLARYSVIEERSAPVPEVAVSLGQHVQRILVPQWVDENGDDQIDWLQQQIAAIVARGLASDIEIVREVLQSVDSWQQSWRRDCGGVLPQSPTVVQIGAACLNAEGLNTHRTNFEHELAATILHEARHVWNYRHPGRTGLPRVYSPSRAGHTQCEHGNAGECAVAQPGLNMQAVEAHELDAESFAQRYKGALR